MRAGDDGAFEHKKPSTVYDLRIMSYGWAALVFLFSTRYSLITTMKVLVADDSGVMRKIIIRALNACGVTDIVEAGDGAEAIAKFGETSVDLVMTDWNMPNKTGLDVVKEIRATGSTVPIFMITTEAEMSRVKEAIAAGVNDYLAKPFENDLLRQKIDKFVCV